MKNEVALAINDVADVWAEEKIEDKTAAEVDCVFY